MLITTDSPGYSTDDCWALRNKVQDLINATEIQFEAPERPNVVTAPMPQHGVNVVEEDLYVASVEDIVTPLLTVKRNLLLAGLFPGCSKGCLLCAVSPAGCPLLKSGIQNLMDSKEILFEKIVVPVVPTKEVSIVTIFNKPPKALSKKPVKIMSTQKIAPIIITVPGPLPYTSDKAVPWHYGADFMCLG